MSSMLPPDDADLPALMKAIRAGDHQTVDSLLRRKPELANGRDSDGHTPLHLAAEYNDPVLGILLLAFGANAQARFGDSGHTPLSWAVTCNAPEFAQALVRAGVKPDLFVAAGMGSLDMVKLCFDEFGQLQPNSVQTGSTRFDSNGSRLPCPPATVVDQISDALYMACRNGHLDVARFLLGKEPDLRFKAYLGGSLLHWACFGNSGDVIQLIELAGGDPSDTNNAMNMTPRAFGICVPANWGILELVQRQLKRDPTLIHLIDGNSALHEAAKQGHLSIVQFLLHAGVDRAMRDHNGHTAAALARLKGHEEIVTHLAPSS